MPDISITTPKGSQRGVCAYCGQSKDIAWTVTDGTKAGALDACHDCFNKGHGSWLTDTYQAARARRDQQAGTDQGT
jgi:hypothetical protein